MNFLSILMNNSTTAAQLAEVETGFFTGILTFLLLPWVSYIVITIFFIALIIFHERGQIGWSHTVFIIIVAYLLFKFNITDFKSIINNRSFKIRQTYPKVNYHPFSPVCIGNRTFPK